MRLLTLVMVLEALATGEPKHAAAQALLDRWRLELEKEKRIPSARQLDTLEIVSSWRAEGIRLSVRAYLGKFEQEGKLKRKGKPPIAEKKVDPLFAPSFPWDILDPEALLNLLEGRKRSWESLTPAGRYQRERRARLKVKKIGRPKQS